MKRPTWIDLTDIEQWTGHHGGTQRVVYGIAKEYYLDPDSEARFFSYSSRENIFYETSFKPIYDRVEQLKTQVTTQQSVTSKKQMVKQKLLHYAPGFVKDNPVTKRRLKKIAKRGLAGLRRVNNVRHTTLHRLARRRLYATGKTSIEFQSGEVVLILGKPWDNPGLQKLLAKQKSQSNFMVVQVVYDLIISLYPHLHHPSLFKSYTQHMFDAVVVSDLMLPISKSSDRDLKRFCDILNLPVPKTSVIRLGDELSDLVDANRPHINIADKFILCVGTIENRKNHTLLYQAYKLAEQKKIDLPQLIIVGGRGWLADDIQYLINHDPSMRNKIIVMNNVNDSSLSWLYQNCMFTVFPSLYEGWGLPVAESFAYGKLCLSSNVSSMPEIAGGLADYFSPYDSGELLALIYGYTSDANLLEHKEIEIKKSYKKTSWHSTYFQVRQAL